MMKNILKTALFSSIAGIAAALLTVTAERSALGMPFTETLSPKEAVPAFAVFLFVVLLFTLTDLLHLRKSGEPYLPEKEKKTVYSKSRDKIKAQGKPVPRQYLSGSPSGLTVGRKGKRFVSIPFLHSPEHQLILGSSGTGKTQTILNALVWNYNFEEQDRRVRAVLAVDSKPELSRKSVSENREDVRIVSPVRKDRWGFDVWYGLSRNSSDDDLDERSTAIALSLIPDLSDDNRHFSNNAQKLLSGFLMYGFRKGWGFAETVYEINSRSVCDFVAEVLTDPEVGLHPKIAGKLQPFDGNTSDEFHSIVSNMTEHLSIFNRDNVRYFFSENPRKVTPEDLVNGNSIFLSVPDHLMTQYKYVFGLCIELCLKHLMSMPEEPSAKNMPYWVLIDEGGMIYVPSLLEVATRGRSKGIQLSVIAQDAPELEVLYGREQTKTLMNNCRTKIIFSCSDTETAGSFKEWCGSFRESKISRNRKGGTGSVTISSEYHHIVEPSDIYSLEKTDRVLVFVRGDWFLADKAPLYSIKELLEKSEEIIAENEPWYRRSADPEEGPVPDR